MGAAAARRKEQAQRNRRQAYRGGVSCQAKKLCSSTPDRARRKARSEMPFLPVDKSVLLHPEPRRIRDRDHVRYVMKQPCLVCGRRPSDPHHLRFAQWRALGRKVSDEFTVPLCRTHHREIHRCGSEGSRWQNTGMDPLAAARALWLETHPLSTEGARAGNQDRPVHRS
jgi:hypothetical protein